MQEPAPASESPQTGVEPGHVRPAGEQEIDVREVMDRNREAGRSDAGKLGVYGARGWTDRLAPQVLGPYTSSTYAPYAYRAGSHGFPHSTNGDTGLVSFGGVGHVGAGQLLDSMPSRALDERQNDSPTARTMLQAAVEHLGKVELSGYVVGSERADERVSVDGVYLFDDGITDARQALFAARDTYGLTDALRRPETVHEVEVPWRPGERAWRLQWW